LPANLKFAVLDVMASEPPAELLAAFDVVHIRFFNAIVKNNNVQPVISMVTKLLKPGGWLQWEEMNPNTLSAMKPRPEVDCTYSQKTIDLVLRLGAMTDMRFEYVFSTPGHSTLVFESASF
jgi:hypothetical protein